MLYAKVVVGLPVEGPFDYIVPEELHEKIKTGERAWVNFANRKLVAYVVALSRKSSVRNLKTITSLIDEAPLLDKNILLLTKKLSQYYYCSWGEAICAALPQALRKGRPFTQTKRVPAVTYGLQSPTGNVRLIHSLESRQRWDRYIQYLKEALKKNQSCIIILPDIHSISLAKEAVQSALGEVGVSVLYRDAPKELEEWDRIISGRVKIVIGSRSAVFAPLKCLGLIIIDEEEDSVYKQEQVPHYHCRQVAVMRQDIEKADLILGSSAPSLEAMYLCRKKRQDSQKKKEYLFLPGSAAPAQVKIINLRSEYNRLRKSNAVLSEYLEDAITKGLNAQGKALLFLNRKGFATSCACNRCGVVLKCPRCNINLVYHFKEKVLSCHYCNFKMPAPLVCSNCNAGYIKYSGMGTEKIESELYRIFPQARTRRIDSGQEIDIESADIFIATAGIIKRPAQKFGLVGVLSIDNTLNRVDLRSAEKAFVLLSRLSALAGGEMVIQTALSQHHCFQAILKNDVNLFYEEELKQRKQLGFPPFRHLILIKVRSKIEEKAVNTAQALFDKLKEAKAARGAKIISVNPAQPAKLRGNFYWQILLSCTNVLKANRFLKINLKHFSHSGIIVMVDVDPV